jgi:hypothetical protein
VLSFYEVPSSSLHMKTLLFQILKKWLKEIQGGEIWVILGKIKNCQDVTLSSGRSPDKKKEATEILLLVFKSPIWQNLRIITTLAI